MPFLRACFSSGSGVKNPPASAEDAGSTPGEGAGNPLRYSCLGNAMDRGAWWATVHKVAKSQTGLKQLSTYTHVLVELPLILMFTVGQ